MKKQTISVFTPDVYDVPKLDVMLLSSKISETFNRLRGNTLIELKENDKSKAFCEDCKDLITTTMQYRDVPFDDGSAIVKNILVGVCDNCGIVVSIPAQSTPAIAEAKRKANNAFPGEL